MDTSGFIPDHRAPGDKNQIAWWFAFHKGELLIAEQDGAVCIPQLKNLSELKLSTSDEVYLGQLRGLPCFAAELVTGESVPEGMSLRKLRPLFEELSEEHIALASRAAQLIHWHKTHLFCGRCGAPTIDDTEQRAKKCPQCGLLSFPRISPAVIVAVIKDHSILLARDSRFKQGLYSVLAGFVEPGESLEDTVHRELYEETGIKVKNVRYFASQPWPFPDSLMVAFTAEYAGGEISVDGTEIIDAGWYGPDDLPQVPSKVSVARRLIDWFGETHS